MKRIAILFLFIILYLPLSAQDKTEANVSFRVLSEFAKLYPNAKKVKWNIYSGNPEGTFLQKGKQIVAIFKADQLFATKTELDKSALPEPVKKHLAQKYKGFSIIYAGKIHFNIKPLNKTDHFTADLTNRSVTKRVLCFANGAEESVSDLPNKTN